MIIQKRSRAGIAKLHHKAYGRGLGSFLKDGLNALKATGKQVGKVLKSSGQAVVSHLKEAAKSSINRGITHGKEILSNVANEAMNQGQKIIAENTVQLQKDLKDAKNLKDIGQALKTTAQNVVSDLKVTSKDIAMNTVEDLKSRGLDMTKEAIKDLTGMKGEGVKHQTISKLLATKKKTKDKGGAIFLPGGSEGRGIYMA